MNPASRLRRSLSARIARPLAQRGRLLLDAARVGLHPTTGEDPDEKGVRQRVAENVRWAARHGEVNDYYYLYGLHRDGAPPPDDFLSVREMMFLIGRQVRDEKAQGVAGVLKDKYLFSLVAQALGYRSPRVLAFLDCNDVTWLSPRETISYDALASEGGAVDGFVKPLRGRQATGAFTLQVRDGTMRAEGLDTSPADVRARVAERSILQERIVQHEALAALHAPSINTIRLVTTLRDGVATPLVAALRIGTGGKPVDNWSAGGVVVGIDLEEGRLRGRGIYKPATRDLLRAGRLDHHPDSGVTFDGYELPFFHEGVALACDFHRDLGSLRSVGWDLAVAPDGPVLVEGNTSWNGAMFMALDAGFKARYFDAVGVAA